GAPPSPPASAQAAAGRSRPPCSTRYRTFRARCRRPSTACPHAALSPRRQQVAALGRTFAYALVDDDLAPGLAPVSVGLAPSLAAVANVADVGMPPSEVTREVSVGEPNEPGLLVLLRFARELVAHAGHDAGEEGPPVPVAPDPVLDLVLAPKALGGRDEV